MPLGVCSNFLGFIDQLDKRNLGFGCFSSCQRGFKKTQAIFSLKTTWHLDASGRSEVSDSDSDSDHKLQTQLGQRKRKL